MKLWSPILAESKLYVIAHIFIINLFISEIQETAMRSYRGINRSEHECIIDLYYIIEMKFIMEKIIFQFEQEHFVSPGESSLVV